jgi:DNA-3-methyladenine glycosylase II
MSQFQIPAHGPLDFGLALAYLQRSSDEILDVVVDGVAHRRALPGSRGPGLIEIRALGPEEQAGLSARVLSGELPEPALRGWVNRVYRLEDPPLDLRSREPLAQSLIDAFGGLPLLQAGSPYEALVWAILGQQITTSFAYRLKRRFIEEFGARLDYQGRTYHVFPTPERVANLDHELHLRPHQFSRQKSRYVIELSQAIVEGRLDLEQVGLLDDEAALAALQAFPGIGRWTAEYSLMRGFGRRDVVPAADAGLKMALGNHLDLRRSATEEEVRAYAEQWRPYRGEIAFRVWFARQRGWFKR